MTEITETLKNNIEKFRRCNESSVVHYVVAPAEGVHLYTNAAVVVANVVLSILGVIANTLVISSYLVNRRLKTIPNMILVVLAVSDFMVAAFVQPLFLAGKLKEIAGNGDCYLSVTYILSSYFSCGVSLLTVVVLSVERYIALAYPYRYQRIVTSIRLQAVTALLWLFALSTILLYQLGLYSVKVFHGLGATIIICSITTVVSIWIWIDRLICRHKKDIKNKQTPLNEQGQTTQTIRRQKIFGNIRTSYMIVVAVLICFTPEIGLMVYYSMGFNSFLVSYLIVPWASTITYVNSLINPVLLFLRNKTFRGTARRILYKHTCNRKIGIMDIQ